MNKSGWVQTYFFLAIIITKLFEKLSIPVAQILHIVIFFVWMFYLSQKPFNGKNKYNIK
jgi:putative flippase GtrA